MKIRRVVNDTKGATAAEHVEIAEGLWARFWGLQFRRRLDEGRGLLLMPCSSVHTFFMRFPIDVVYLDRENVVLKIVPAMKPWRTSAARGARYVLELPAGAAARTGLEPGDRLRLVDV